MNTLSRVDAETACRVVIDLIAAINAWDELFMSVETPKTEQDDFRFYIKYSDDICSIAEVIRERGEGCKQFFGELKNRIQFIDLDDRQSRTLTSCLSSGENAGHRGTCLCRIAKRSLGWTEWKTWRQTYRKDDKNKIVQKCRSVLDIVWPQLGNDPADIGPTMNRARLIGFPVNGSRQDDIEICVSQSQIAKAFGIGKSTVSRWVKDDRFPTPNEYGNFPASSVQAYAGKNGIVLSVSWDEVCKNL